jgi:hypothetical protein
VQGGRQECGGTWSGCPHTQSYLPVIVPTTLRFPSLQIFLIFCACFHRVHPPFLPPTKVTTQQALINVIFFWKSSWKKAIWLQWGRTGSWTPAALYRPEPQPQEQNEEECNVALGSWWAWDCLSPGTCAVCGCLAETGSLSLHSFSQPFVFCCWFPGW